MSQHDYDIANQLFPATRADWNTVLAAIATNNMGAADPAVKFDGQLSINTAPAPQRNIKLWDGAAYSVLGRWDTTVDRFIPAGQIAHDLYVPAGGTGDALTLTLNYPLAGYQDGLTVITRLTADNTGPATLNVNGLGLKDIKGLGNTVLPAGVLKTGAIAIFVYDATQGVFQVLNSFDSAPAAASTTQSGIVELATESEAETGTDATRAVTPKALAAVANGAQVDIASATTCDLGSVKSSNLRITGTTTIDSFGTSPNGLRKHCVAAGAFQLTYNAGSMVLEGGVSITTAAGDTFEPVSLGSGNWRVEKYHRANGKALVESSSTFPFSAYYDSGEQTITAAGTLTLAHGLGGVPKGCQAFLKCVTGEGNYSAGHIILVSPDAASNERGVQIRTDDATNLILRYGLAGWEILNATTGGIFGITPANWRLIVRAWR